MEYMTQNILRIMFVALSQHFLSLFSRNYKINQSRHSKSLTYIDIEFNQYPNALESVKYISCAPNINCSESTKDICKAYANHGNCQDKTCKNSHNVDYILACEDNKQPKRKKKKRDHEVNERDSIETDASKLSKGEKISDCSKDISQITTVAGHRAGMDAFMTGYSYAAFTWHKTKVSSESTDISTDMKDINIANHIYLVGKEIPLIVKKSNFAKNSTSHIEKYENVISELSNMSTNV